MNDAPIQIQNPEVARAVRDMARALHRPITDAVRMGVDELARGHRAVEESSRASRLAALDEVSAWVRTLPRIGPDLTDDDLYGEDGLPK